jgi:hypothetical protein
MVGGVSQEEQGTAARVYGVLATSLKDAVEESRQALSGHVDLVRAGLLTDFDTVLAEFDRRRVRIAIYGEVKAGKSTLLNAIAGAPLSPAAFDPLTSIPVRVTYGGQTRWRAGDRVFDSVSDLAQMMRAGSNGVHEVVVETDLDLLQLGGQVDLLDTPGVGSEDRFGGRTRAACQHATLPRRRRARAGPRRRARRAAGRAGQRRQGACRERHRGIDRGPGALRRFG